MRRSMWKCIDIMAYSLLLIGALNWGSVALFEMDFVAMLFGPMSAVSRMVYGLVGLAALYDLVSLQAICRRWEIHMPGHAVHVHV